MAPGLRGAYYSANGQPLTNANTDPNCEVVHRGPDSRSQRYSQC